jgi:hypothetical protein
LDHLPKFGERVPMVMKNIACLVRHPQAGAFSSVFVTTLDLPIAFLIDLIYQQD